MLPGARLYVILRKLHYIRKETGSVLDPELLADFVR